MKRTYSYLIIVLTIYAAFTVLFTIFPRSTFSELEKRELATFPKLTLDSLAKGLFTSSVSYWFSDSEPYRDKFIPSSGLDTTLHRATSSSMQPTAKPSPSRPISWRKTKRLMNTITK